MKRYEVEFSQTAIADIDSSFEWGCEKWGVAEAASWYFTIRDTINARLTASPLGCSPAPEQHRYRAPARVLVIDRYNVIFHVERSLVTILHIRGPFTESKL